MRRRGEPFCPEPPAAALTRGEGIVAKGMNQCYLAGHRGWSTIRRRHSTEAITGTVTGTLVRPPLLILGP